MTPVRNFTLIASAVLALALSGSAQAQTRDAAVFAAAQAAQPAVIETLQQLVKIESGSGNLDGLSKVADFAEARLKTLGAQTERIKSVNSERPILKGVLTGNGKLKVMLLAHMDTVYPDGILATQSYRLDGNKLYGPGIADDKGGMAVILHSLSLLKDLGWRDYASITVLFNADEEIGSAGSGETIAALGALNDVVLSYEPTAAKQFAKDEGVLLGAAGATTATMEVKGRASHAGAAPELGRNALIELSHQMLATQDIAKDIPGAQLNWTYAQGGLVRNQIPERAHAFGDVRLTAPGASEKLLAALQSKIKESKRVPDTEVSVNIAVGRPPYLGGERGLALAKRAQAIYAELDGRKLLLHPMTGGGTDAGYASLSGKPAVLESMGLPGWGYHAKDEFIEIDAIVPRLYLTARMLQELAKNPVK
jgi:glutamate carboxypeptidase